MIKQMLIPGLIGLLIGGFGGPYLQRPPSCPECPSLECPPNVSIQANPLDLDQIRKFKGDITQSTVVHGDVYLICDNDTIGPYQSTRGMLDSIY